LPIMEINRLTSSIHRARWCHFVPLGRTSNRSKSTCSTQLGKARPASCSGGTTLSKPSR
jgi:hypothetical protein